MTLAHDSELTERVISLAIEVHRHLGPGLLESAYEECLSYELKMAGIPHRRQVEEVRLDCGYRMDIVVRQNPVLEIKAVEQVIPLHEAQILTYLRLSANPVGLLMNFQCCDAQTRAAPLRFVTELTSVISVSPWFDEACNPI